MDDSNQTDIQEILGRLKKSGLSDEQIAVGIGSQLPGNINPSSMSVYRWRSGKNKPSPVFGIAVRRYSKQFWEERTCVM